MGTVKNIRRSCSFSASVKSSVCAVAGLLTYSRFEAFPARRPVAKSFKTVFSPFEEKTRAYSSGNCCRLSRHSLFIPRIRTDPGETIAGTNVRHDGEKKISSAIFNIARPTDAHGGARVFFPESEAARQGDSRDMCGAVLSGLRDSGIRREKRLTKPPA